MCLFCDSIIFNKTVGRIVVTTVAMTPTAVEKMLLGKVKSSCRVVELLSVNEDGRFEGSQSGKGPAGLEDKKEKVSEI